MKTIFYFIFGFILVLLTQLVSQQKQTNPHGNIKIDCAECHTSKGWQIEEARSFFNHSRTGFPLLGAHRNNECSVCHTNLIFSHTGTACADCHIDIHKSELGINCDNCHTPQNWDNRQEILENHNLTRFPLIAIHSIIDCEACHFNQQRNEFANTPTDCEYCHRENYIAAINPDHQMAQFSLDCISCHKFISSNWEQTEYQHPESFQLLGSHTAVECSDCHTGTYAGTSQTCESCHLDDYNNTEIPKHLEFGFPTDCLMCHNENQWTDAFFDHNQNTGYELGGVHESLRCIDCHSQGYNNTPTDCWSCHETDFTGVADPNHVLNSFNHDCTICHSAQAWLPATFDHSSTNFPLAGAHTSLNCIDCHSQGYNNTPYDCWSCHETDFTGAADPNHVQNNFNHDCTICHSVQAWLPATFDHSSTNFPLTGAHTSLDCADCHSQGYSGTPIDCYSCHDSDYNNTTNPNHIASGFPTSCEDCHNTTNWNQTTWDHDLQYFPIYSGKHQNEWTDCNDCHVDPNNYSIFECILCHEHSNQSQVNDDHSEVSGYIYASWACYDCHPTGEEKSGVGSKVRKAH